MDQQQQLQQQQMQQRQDLQAFIQSQAQFSPFGGDTGTGSNATTTVGASSPSKHQIPFGVRNCPECQYELDFDGVYSRPAQEECGHVKCRSCVIHSMARGESCRQCAHGMFAKPAVWGNLIIHNFSGNASANTNSGSKTQVNITAAKLPPTTIQHFPSFANYKDKERDESKTKNFNKFPSNLFKPNTVPHSIAASSFCRDGTNKIENENGRGPFTIMPIHLRPTTAKTAVAVATATFGSLPTSPVSTNENQNQNDGTVNSNSSVTNFTCYFCRKSFSSLWILNLHLGMHSTKNFTSLECERCHQSFADVNELSSHSILHSVAERPFQCFVCGTNFTMKKSLNHHMRHFHGDTTHNLANTDKQVQILLQSHKNPEIQSPNHEKLYVEHQPMSHAIPTINIPSAYKRYETVLYNKYKMFVRKHVISSPNAIDLELSEDSKAKINEEPVSHDSLISYQRNEIFDDETRRNSCRQSISPDNSNSSSYSAGTTTASSIIMDYSDCEDTQQLYTDTDISDEQFSRNKSELVDVTSARMPFEGEDSLAPVTVTENKAVQENQNRKIQLEDDSAEKLKHESEFEIDAETGKEEILLKEEHQEQIRHCKIRQPGTPSFPGVTMVNDGNGTTHILF